MGAGREEMVRHAARAIPPGSGVPDMDLPHLRSTFAMKHRTVAVACRVGVATATALILVGGSTSAHELPQREALEAGTSAIALSAHPVSLSSPPWCPPVPDRKACKKRKGMEKQKGKDKGSLNKQKGKNKDRQRV